MLLADLSFCVRTSPVWSLVGKILMVFKIAIPILLIVFGMIDLGKAVIASKEDAIQKATTSLIRRLIAGVVIFFVPFIVGAVFNLIKSFQDDAKRAEFQYEICEKCVTSPYGNKCNTAVNQANDA